MRKAFTLLELLIVIGILAILATVTFVVLNPAELLKQTRDSKRVQDLSTLNKAVELVHISNTNLSLGSSSVVYVSLADTSSNCSNLSLPSLPTGWSYRCVIQANLRKVDGQGWIPINFTSSTFGSPLAILPIDPINNASSGLYYIYVTGGSWKLTGLFESEKQVKFMASDGGPDNGLYETGSDLELANFAKGLAGYWKFDGNFNDASGNNNNGTQSGGVSFASGKQDQAGSFDGSDDYVNAGNNSSLNFTNSLTIAAWVKTNDIANTTQGIMDKFDGSNGFFLRRWGDFQILVKNGGTDYYTYDTTPTTEWFYLAGVVDPTNNRLKFYVNGVLKKEVTGYYAPATATNLLIGTTGPSANGVRWNGLIDEVRIYNRALSATEIKAIYDATK